LRKYSSISVPAEVKRVLEEAKGDEEWGEFLLELYTRACAHAFERLMEALTDEDLKGILESSREFREGFSLEGS